MSDQLKSAMRPQPKKTTIVQQQGVGCIICPYELKDTLKSAHGSAWYKDFIKQRGVDASHKLGVKVMEGLIGTRHGPESTCTLQTAHTHVSPSKIASVGKALKTILKTHFPGSASTFDGILSTARVQRMRGRLAAIRDAC